MGQLSICAAKIAEARALAQADFSSLKNSLAFLQA